MNKLEITRLLLILFAVSIPARAQLWSPILSKSTAIDWTQAGVGKIPARTAVCANLTASATVTQINLSLISCPPGQTVSLAAGTYTIAGTIVVPSQVTLRGAGADQTILNATGTGGGFVISLGSGGAPYHPIALTGGAMAGSTNVQVSDASAISAGLYLAISEQNDPSYVSAMGSEGNCNWCDGWTSNGELARGQIVALTAVKGTTITISPALYASYTHSPVAVPFNMSTTNAGVENLQVRANNTGYQANFSMSACAYCWIKGVESNYTDGDHVDIDWGLHDEVRDSYFSNAFLHTPGMRDSDIQIALKTSASLIENNIIERAHESVMLEWGAAGNVIAYNYMMGEFDSGSPNVVIGGINFHGAHPQFNLLEGNVLAQIYADSVWGTSSHTTAFRNWITGTNRVCSPMSGRGKVDCSSAQGHYAFQAARAVQISYFATKNNFVGNIVGSAPMQSLSAYGKPIAQIPRLEFPAERSYDTAAIGWSFGYGDLSDSGHASACRVEKSTCHLKGTSATNLLDGNYNNIDGTTHWTTDITNTLPPSFYLADKPQWWGNMPFPAIGPDVSGTKGPGGHSYGNPAQSCYIHSMGGSDGGAGSPLRFNADSCYQSNPANKPSANKTQTAH